MLRVKQSLSTLCHPWGNHWAITSPMNQSLSTLCYPWTNHWLHFVTHEIITEYIMSPMKQSLGALCHPWNNHWGHYVTHETITEYPDVIHQTISEYICPHGTITEYLMLSIRQSLSTLCHPWDNHWAHYVTHKPITEYIMSPMKQSLSTLCHPSDNPWVDYVTNETINKYFILSNPGHQILHSIAEYLTISECIMSSIRQSYRKCIVLKSSSSRSLRLAILLSYCFFYKAYILFLPEYLCVWVTDY